MGHNWYVWFCGIDDYMCWNSCLWLSGNYGYVESCGIKLFMCSNLWLMFWNKLFWEFCLNVWKPWICWWLLFKHVLNHLLNHWVWLYVDGLWMVYVGCEVWIEMWSFGVFGEKWVWWWKLDDLVLWTHVLIHFNVTLKYVNCW